MELSKKDKTIKYTLYCVILAAAALLQNVQGLWLQIGGARCFLLVPAALLLSLGEDERTAALLGLFAGFLWDSDFLLRNTYWVAVVSAAIGTFIYCMLYWLIIVMPHGGDGSVLSLLYFYLPSFVYTAAVGIVLGMVFSPIKKKLNKGVAE